MSSIVNTIELKSQGLVLSSDQIHDFVKSVFHNAIDDAQIGAFLMAIKLKGMNAEETADLTKAMAGFSYKFDWSKYEWKNSVVDKHSTGGVGDKISHILAPILSACGLKMPMISGRGLGITGGTIDKLESINGFFPIDDVEKMPTILESAGFFITGQTDTMIPVDKRFYAIRDVTATVDSIPLITSSILSKKKIEDIQILLMDIKFGKGTFMKTEKDANELAEAMIATGKSLDMEIICLIDDMNSPLGCCIGNALEIAEVLRALNGVMLPDTKEIIYVMATEILKYIEKTMTEEDIKKKIDQVIGNGSALERFKEMLLYQGVDQNLANDICVHQLLSIKDYLLLLNRGTLKITDIPTKNEGYVHYIDAEKIGIVTRDHGGGRRRKEDEIHYGVGVELHFKEGNSIKNGDIWAKVYHNRELTQFERDTLDSAMIIKPEKHNVIKRIKRILKSY